MSIEVYYFSGTGNSLHVAKELQKRIHGIKLIPMVSLLKKDTIKIRAETIGFIFPIYITLAPVPVRRFLEKADVTSSVYIFTIITREGTLCLAHNYVESILKKSGKTLDATFILNMAQNSPTGIKPTPGDQNWIQTFTMEKLSGIESGVQQQLDVIVNTITNKQKYPEENNYQPVRSFFARLLSWITDKIESKVNFLADKTCTGCGICEKVCLSCKIAMIDGRPVWQQEVRCFSGQNHLAWKSTFSR